MAQQRRGGMAAATEGCPQPPRPLARRGLLAPAAVLLAVFGAACSVRGSSQAGAAYLAPVARPEAPGSRSSSSISSPSPDAIVAAPVVSRSFLRHLPATAAASLLVAGVDGQQASALAPGDAFEVNYTGPVPKDDFTLGGFKTYSLGVQYSHRVTRVEPGGVAAKAGLEVGDILTGLRKGAAIVAETTLRVQPEDQGTVDSQVKRIVSSQFYRDIDSGKGASVYFTKGGLPQPGQAAPEFTLAGSNGTKVSLDDLVAGGKKAVVFFRPGAQYPGGDTRELKAFKAASGLLTSLGASVVGVSKDQTFYLTRQVQLNKLPYKLLADPRGEVAKTYGALIEFQDIDPATNRFTFVIGPDKKVLATFPAVGWEAGTAEYATHLSEVVGALGGDRSKGYEAVLPPEKTVGDFFGALR